MPEGPRKALVEWYERKNGAGAHPRRAPLPRHQEPFGYRKVSYRGIAKNEARAKAQAALVNLCIAKRRLMAQGLSVLQPELGPESGLWM